MKKIVSIVIMTLFSFACSKSSDGFAPGTGNLNSTITTGIYNSCQQILSANATATSGVYSISYDGSGSVASTFNVYCDMTTNGGGWTLVMKQASNDGVTLQGDTAYFTSASAGTLNDNNTNLGTLDQNLVSAAFKTVSGTNMMLVAANEATYKTQAVSSTAFLAFATATTFADDVNATRPNWFITTTTYPNGNAITAGRFGFNVREATTVGGTTYYCAARWGWMANQDSSGSSVGTFDSCGGLGAYGTQYGSTFMSSNKSAWQPALLMLYIK